MNNNEHQKLVYINHITSGSDKIDLGPFIIRRFTEDELAKGFRVKELKSVVEHYKDGSQRPMTWSQRRWNRDSDLINLLSLMWCAVFQRGEELEFPSYLAGDDFVRDIRSLVVLDLLRLTRRGLVTLGNEIKFDSYGLDMAIHENHPPSKYGINPYVLDGEAITTLGVLAASLWGPLTSIYQKPSSDVINALHFFRKAPMNAIYMGVILDLWISAEAMCGEPGPELSYRLCQKLAVLSMTKEDELHHSFERYKKLYRKRNEWVHGGVNLPKLHNVHYTDMIEQILELEEPLRRALRRYLCFRLIKGLSRKELHQRLEKAIFEPQERNFFLTGLDFK